MTNVSTGTPVDRIVDPTAVHRVHPDTVFLTGARSDGTGGYVATGVLPDGHSYYSAHTAPGNRRLDPMLVLELCRQAQIFLGHAYFGIDRDAHFVLNSCSLHLATDAYTLLPQHGHGELTMTTRDMAPHRVGRRAPSLSPEYTLVLDGVPIGRVGISTAHLPPTVYTALRHRYRPDPPPYSDQLPYPNRTGLLTPAAVGRTAYADVLLADLRTGREGISANLMVPFDHLGLFDHRLDHVPGSLLVEAARQLATTLSSDPTAAIMTEMTAEFRKYADLDAPVRLTARKAGETLSMSALQNDVEVAAVTVQTQVPAAGRGR